MLYITKQTLLVNTILYPKLDEEHSEKNPENRNLTQCACKCQQVWTKTGLSVYWGEVNWHHGSGKIWALPSETKLVWFSWSQDRISSFVYTWQKHCSSCALGGRQRSHPPPNTKKLDTDAYSGRNETFPSHRNCVHSKEQEWIPEFPDTSTWVKSELWCWF